MSSTSGAKYLSGVYDCLSASLQAKNSKTQTNFESNELATWFCFDPNKYQKRKLRRELNKVLKRNNNLTYSDINRVVKEFINPLKSEKANEVEIHMLSLFYCKCGWLLYNRFPTTLPCGHTICKECVDNYQVCRYCDEKIKTPTHQSVFLVELTSRWCKELAKSTEKMKEAAELLKATEYNKALEITNELLEVEETYKLLNIRSEIYSKLGLLKKALRDADRSCELNYECGQSHYRRGICLSDLGDLNEAIDAFQVCLEVEPLDLALANDVISSIDRILSLSDPESDNINLKNIDEIDSSSDSESSSKKVKLNTTIKNEYNIEKETNNITFPSSSIDITKTDNLPSITSISEDLEIKMEKCNKTTNLECKDSTKNEILKNPGEKLPVVLKYGVPEDLIKEEDLECKLCYDILLHPVTTTCGHVFCKKCIWRTLDHNAVCPICRLALNDYAKVIHQKPPTHLIVQILELFFEEPYNKRKKAYQEKMEELSRVGIDQNVEVPIFVCSIAFPYVQCPLHIFEPKYRLMIRECLESGSRRFGMCSPANNGNEMSDIGAICEITKCQSLPDGRFIVHTTASQRFLVASKTMRDSIVCAKVTYFKDEPEDLHEEEQLELSRTIYQQLSDYVNSLATAQQDCIFNALGTLPNYEEDATSYEHGVPWVWWGLAALPLNFSAKLVLLRSKCVSERMLSLQRFLRFLTRMN